KSKPEGTCHAASRKSLQSNGTIVVIPNEVEQSLAVLADAPAFIKTRDDLGWACSRLVASMRIVLPQHDSTLPWLQKLEFWRGFRRPGVGFVVRCNDPVGPCTQQLAQYS